MHRLIATPAYRRRLAKFLRSHPDLAARVRRVLSDLARDPNEPSLRLHPLHGKLEGSHAIRLTREYRIVLTSEAGQVIALADIGGHDEVYR